MIDMKRIKFVDCKPILDIFISSVKLMSGVKIISIAAFGSIARSNGTPESDIDLIIVYKGRRKDIEKKVLEVILRLRETREYQYLEKLGFYPEISPIFMSVPELENHPWILLDVVDHGIILQDSNNRLRNELMRMEEKMTKFGSKKITLPDGSWYWNLKPDLKVGEVFEL
jgi:predicted nucleotidyltransferase